MKEVEQTLAEKKSAAYSNPKDLTLRDKAALVLQETYKTHLEKLVEAKALVGLKASHKTTTELMDNAVDIFEKIFAEQFEEGLAIHPAQIRRVQNQLQRSISKLSAAIDESITKYCTEEFPGVSIESAMLTIQKDRIKWDDFITHMEKEFDFTNIDRAQPKEGMGAFKQFIYDSHEACKSFAREDLKRGFTHAAKDLVIKGKFTEALDTVPDSSHLTKKAKETGTHEIDKGRS